MGNSEKLDTKEIKKQLLNLVYHQSEIQDQLLEILEVDLTDYRIQGLERRIAELDICMTSLTKLIENEEDLYDL